MLSWVVLFLPDDYLCEGEAWCSKLLALRDPKGLYGDGGVSWSLGVGALYKIVARVYLMAMTP